MFINNLNKTALINDGAEISYSELFDNIDRFSALLNISAGDKVAIYSENRAEWIYSFYAVWNRGGICIPVDFLSTPEEVAHILQDSSASVVFTSQKNLPQLNEAVALCSGQLNIIVYDDVILPEQPYKDSFSRFELTEKNRDNIAVLIYTSGTTGSPKGVMLSYDNLLSNIECIVDDAKIYQQDDKIIAILPLHHAFPLQGTMLMPFYAGGTVILLTQLSSDEIIKALQKYKVTMILGVPRLYNLFHGGIISKIQKNKVASLLLKLSRALNSYSAGAKIFSKVQTTFGGSIKYFISGGAKLDEDVARDFKALGFKILEGYGMTEAAPLISFNPPPKVKIGTVGKPFPAVKTKLVDGEVVISGRNIMRGYYNKPEETAEILRDGWLHTGDIGEFDDEGYLSITGRIKEIIILDNGKNLNPEEIEKKVLSLNPLVKEIGVLQKDGQLFAVIYPDFALIQKENIVNIEETIRWNIIDKYNLSVAPYKKILNFTIVHHELPRTRLGKIKRFTLTELIKKENKERVSADIPDYQEYRLLEEYLKELVKKDIFPDEHVELDLGLDSLDKVELQAKIENTFGISMSNEDLSVYSTVRKLADYIKEKKTRIENDVVQWGKLLREDIEYEIPRSTYMLKAAKLLMKPFLRFYLRIEGEGLENIPQDSPVILAPNHQSFLDGLFIADVLKNRTLTKTYFFAKEKNIRSRISRFFARNSNVLVLNINKDLKLTLQRIASVIRKGNNMVIFPEGARSRDGNVMSFKKAFAIISKELNVPVVPVVIEGAYEKFSIGSKFPKPGKIRLRFLKPIYPGTMDYDAITDMARNNIMSFSRESAGKELV